MPSFHSWGPSAQHSRLPLTPPDYQGGYLTPLSAGSEQGYYSMQSYQPHQSQNGRDFIDCYAQVPAYAAQQALTAQAQSRGYQSTSSQDYHKAVTYGQQSLPQYHYVPTSAPILPPIHVSDPVDAIPVQYSHAHPEQKQKEEKATGGVAAHLDYSMDLMASFVAEMSQGIVVPGSKPTSQFRKYVSQILSSTRLPSSTIMLGLFYLARRMKIVGARGDDTTSSGTVYRMLTTCLLLGSKFLDDNTFQNRSWAEVSSIPVHELNSMELQWLEGFDWEIHGPMYNKKEGFFKWIDYWHEYKTKAQMAKAKEFQKLAPIDTTYYRSHTVVHQPLMSPDGPIPPQYQRGPQYDTQWIRPLITEYSPPSAPHSGPATPDYYSGSWNYAPAPPPYSRSSWNSNSSSAYTNQRSQAPAHHHTPAYAPQHYGQSVWTGHGSSCTCTLCAKHPDYYFTQSGYGLQPVAG